MEWGMKNIYRLIACGAIAFALVGCGASGGSNAPSPNTVVSTANNVLQLAAGTFNYAGITTGLNVVTTYRQPAGGFAPGDSGTLLNSPTLSLPAAIPPGAAAPPAVGESNTLLNVFDACSVAEYGAGANEVGTTNMTSTSQTAGSTAITTFGQSAGVFAIGIQPYNATGNGDCTPPGLLENSAGVPNPAFDGTPFTVQPYPVPIYDTATSTDANQLPSGWGGPPAFVLAGSGGASPIYNSNYPRTGCALDGLTGVEYFCYGGLPMGIDAFLSIPPVASGKYTLSVSVPGNTGTTTTTASFTMPAALTVLPTIAAPPAYTPNGNGGGTFGPFVMPAGATEAFLEVVDYGADNGPSCNGAGTADTNRTTGNAATYLTGGLAGQGLALYYTVELTASGTFTLPNSIGPGSTAAAPVPTICTAAQNSSTTTNPNNPTPAGTDDDQIAIQVIAVDYPLYEANPINSAGKPAPTILGAGGSSDMTMSPAVCQQGAGACIDTLPLLRRRAPGHTTIMNKSAGTLKVR